MEIKHGRQVAELHYQYLNSFLTDLGRRMCIVFYENALKSAINFGYAFVEDSQVLGFIFATEDNSQPFRDNRIRLEIILSLLQRPRLIKNLLSHLRNEVPPAPEQLYSATDLKARRKGIAKKLYAALHQEFKKRGVAFYEIRIDADNIAHLKLSQKLGAKIKDKFIENGICRYRLQMRIE